LTQSQSEHLRALWAIHPRLAFEDVIPQDSRMDPKVLSEGMAALLAAGVLPIKQAPNGLDEDGATPPWVNARWSFMIEGHGWLDGLGLYNTLDHEEYIVPALVGLGIPLPKIARAISQIANKSAWGGLGAVGQLWGLGQRSGDALWMREIPGIQELAKEAVLATAPR